MSVAMLEFLLPLARIRCIPESAYLKACPNWTTLFANMSIIMLVECSWTFHVVDRSGQIGQHCSPTNSIRDKLNVVYVV